MSAARPQCLTTHLVALLDQAFDRGSWHGPNLRGSLRGLSFDAVLWRPGRGRHNIWELMLHAAYWKYMVRRRMTQERRAFGRPGRNFWVRSTTAQPSEWRSDLALLIHEHHLLRNLVTAFPAGRLNARVGRSRFTYAQMVQGVAAHDVYHAGQIQLLRRLYTRGVR